MNKQKPNTSKPLNTFKMVDWSYFMGDSMAHRGGWHAIIKHMIDKKYLTKDKGVNFLDLTEGYFLWKNGETIKEKWIGVSHFTPTVPGHWKVCDMNNFLHNENFLRSLKYCHGLVFLSDYAKEHFDTMINNLVRTFSLKHPVGNDIKKFNMENFLNNDKKIILLGQQLRKISSIYKIKTNYPKAWLPGMRDLEKAKERRNTDLIAEKNIPYIDIDLDSVEILYLNDFSDYDDIITQNIILIDVYDASANNSVLELMSANAPFFVRRTPSIEEYLGREYPMFFENLSQVESILSNKENLNDLYRKTHEYLKNLDKKKFSHEYFSQGLLKIIN